MDAPAAQPSTASAPPTSIPRFVGASRSGAPFGTASPAQEHFGRIVEPNHLQRCLDLLEGLPRLDDDDALSVWLERIEDDGPDLSEPARRLLLTEFLDRGYEQA